ncbi:hypothetical protein SAMN05444678_1306 [Sphingomonas sp. YR710]|uniref:hypothetical protein n=1 Tax=Sphingomonas sp. YR710 TaxID=1882773 RepID=UPI000881329D|nr:hypothetical protein [Sphingomonas sp. YR710]SDD88236.1 hypothetical protein SAMN05444678_1306 [Sphingomonas sp. YR710]
MRYREIARGRSELPTPTFTHPFLTRIWLDPVDAERFFAAIDRSEHYQVYEHDRSQADVHVVLLGCSTELVRDHLRREWM